MNCTLGDFLVEEAIGLVTAKGIVAWARSDSITSNIVSNPQPVISIHFLNTSVDGR